MATSTTNYGLTKPEYSDTADIADINDNMDKVDAALGGLGSAVAMIADGDTHATIASGGYVYIRNHSTLAEGLYTANSAIEEDAALTSSNVTASGDLADIIKGLSDAKVMYGTFSTSGNGEINLAKNTYIVLSASKDNYVLVPYTSPGYNDWVLRTITNTAFGNQTGITVAYIKK